MANLSLLIYLLIYFYWTGIIDMLYTRGYNLILLYFVTQIVSAFAIGSYLSWLPCPFDVSPSIWVFFFITFLLSSIKRYSRLILYISISCPSPRISKKEYGSFSWEMELEAKIWMLGVLVVTGVSLLLGPVFSQSRKYMCVQKPMYIYLSVYISLCNHIHLY